MKQDEVAPNGSSAERARHSELSADRSQQRRESQVLSEEPGPRCERSKRRSKPPAKRNPRLEISDPWAPDYDATLLLRRLAGYIPPAKSDQLSGVKEDCGSQADDAEARDFPTVPKVMAWLRDREGGGAGVFLPRLIRMITKQSDQALVLSQILYWHDNGSDGKTRARVRIDGETWLAKQHSEMADETGVPERQIRECLKWLKKAGYIKVRFKFFSGVKTCHMRPELTRILEVIKAILHGGGI